METAGTDQCKRSLGRSNTSSSSFRLRCPSLNSLRLRRIFDLFDKNNDGFITVDELSQALHLLGLDADPSELDSMVKPHIQPGNIGLEFENFEALHRSLNDTFFGLDDTLEEDEGKGEGEAKGGSQDESDLTEAFKVFDEDGDGYISARELQVVLGKLGLPQGREIDTVERMILSVVQLCDETHNVSAGTIGATNISHLVFGIGGSAKTWDHRRHYSELWWQPNITRGYVWLDQKPNPNTSWPEKSPQYRVSEDWTRFKYRSSQSAVRIARIILETFRLGLPEARWFVMGDDDTVFFTDNLVSVLARYDHRQMYYVGGNSESVEQDDMHSYGMAFGGGGFAISYPLAAELVKVLDGCLDRYYTFYGSDQRIWACVSEIGVSLTKEKGFHQIDVRGDAYGLLAAHPAAPLVSLHHLDYVHPLFPGRSQPESLQMLIQAYRFDPSQTLQQSFCHDHKRKWSVSISWGYTAQIYPSLLTAKDLATPLQTFKTWRSWSRGPFTFNTRPVKPDPCEHPVTYFLDKVEEVGKGYTLTTYKMHVAEPKEKCGLAEYADAMAVQRIVVFASKMDPQEWKKAPRRRCCEIIGGLKKNTMRVRMRSCEQGETVTT